MTALLARVNLLPRDVTVTLAGTLLWSAFAFLSGNGTDSFLAFAGGCITIAGMFLLVIPKMWSTIAKAKQLVAHFNFDEE